MTERNSTVLANQHFIKLRDRINQRLRDLQTPDAEEQIKTEWLCGALGAVPADTLFICENPSLTGVRNAAVATVDNGAPDIEAQWWGGPGNNAACRFRRLLVEFGLKAGAVASKGDWACYITNLVKEANIVGHQRRLTAAEQRQQARDWVDVLAWEIEQVQPRVVILVGQQAQHKFSVLQRERLMPAIEWHPMSHYSQRRLSRSEDEVLDRMRAELTTALGGAA
jgi:hypothetical protein